MTGYDLRYLQDMSNTASNKRGFTLIELIVVIFIIALVLALLLPAVQAARSATRRVTCQNNMRQTGLAIHSYVDVNGMFPPAKCTYTYRITGNTTISTIGHGLVPFLLPFMEQTTAASQYNFDKNWQNAANREARSVRINMLLCPESESPRHCRSSTSDNSKVEEFYCSDYAVCEVIWGVRTQLRRLGVDRGTDNHDWRSILASVDLGSRTVISNPPVELNSVPTRNDVLSALYRNPVTPLSITDGLSNSMMLFECASRPFKYVGKYRGDPDVTSKEPIGGARWADPDSQFWLNTICNTSQMFNCTNQQEIYSLHPGGCNFLYGDGTVRFHAETMSPNAFVSSFTAYAGDSGGTP